MKYIQFKILVCILLFVNEAFTEKVNVGITFTKVTENQKFQDKFKTCVASILKYSTVDINFYIIGDKKSQVIARNIFSQIKFVNINYEVSFYFIRDSSLRIILTKCYLFS